MGLPGGELALDRLARQCTQPSWGIKLPDAKDQHEPLTWYFVVEWVTRIEPHCQFGKSVALLTCYMQIW